MMFKIENGTLIGISEECKSVTIPSEVKRIGKGAFKGSNIESVSFTGSALKSIE